MSEAGPYRGLHRRWRTLLSGLCIAALGLDLASGTAPAMPPHNSIGVPPEDFCSAKGQVRTLRADPSNYQNLVPALRRISVSSTLSVPHTSVDTISSFPSSL